MSLFYSQQESNTPSSLENLINPFADLESTNHHSNHPSTTTTTTTTSTSTTSTTAITDSIQNSSDQLTPQQELLHQSFHSLDLKDQLDSSHLHLPAPDSSISIVDQQLGFDGKPLELNRDDYLVSFGSSSPSDHLNTFLHPSSPPRQPPDQLDLSSPSLGEQPFQDLLPSSTSNQFNFSSSTSSPRSLNTLPGSDHSTQINHSLPHPSTQTPSELKRPVTPELPAFRPFGVTATLTSSTLEDGFDEPHKQSHNISNSRPALPDILGGGPNLGGSSSLLHESRSTTLPAFKKSTPKKNISSSTASTTKSPSGSNDTKHPNRPQPSASAPKPYRPLGLKIPELKPIFINPPPNPPSSSTNDSAPAKKANQTQLSETSTQAAKLAPPTSNSRIEESETNHQSCVEPTLNNSHLDIDAIERPDGSHASDESAPSQRGTTDSVLTTRNEAQDGVIDSNLEPKENTPASLSIKVAPPSSSLPSLSPHQHDTQVSENSQDNQANIVVHPERGHLKDDHTETQDLNKNSDSLLQPGPAQPRTESDSEDERPLASVREGLVQQQQQQQQQYATTSAIDNPSSVSTAPGHRQLGGAADDLVQPNEPFYKCTVGDPQKMGMINDIHTVYTVKTTATDPNSSGPLKGSSTVLRRFRDFVWLFDALVANNPGIIVPPIPDKNLRHRFQEGFIAARRVALEFFLQKTVNHPMLTSDPDLKLFLESDSFSLEIKHRKHDSTHQPGWLANIAGPRFVETDDFFENRKVALDTLEGQLKILQGSLSAASKARRAMSQSLSELSDALQVLSTSDLSKPVRKMLERLAWLHKQTYFWSQEQSKDELECLITTIESYARLTNSIRLTFNGRIKSWEKSVFAANHLKKVVHNHEKVKKTCAAGGNVDQSTGLMHSLSELEDAERRAHEARNEFADVSKLIKAEFQRFDKEKVEDFKRSVCKFVDGLTDRQRQIVKIWQDYYQLLQLLAKQNLEANTNKQGGEEEQASGGSSSRPKAVEGSEEVAATAVAATEASTLSTSPPSTSFVTTTATIEPTNDHQKYFTDQIEEDSNNSMADEDSKPLLISEDSAIWASPAVYNDDDHHVPNLSSLDHYDQNQNATRSSNNQYLEGFDSNPIDNLFVDSSSLEHRKQQLGEDEADGFRGFEQGASSI